MDSEKFCLRWNAFQENISLSFQELRAVPDFVDVTLVCEDNQRIESHKFILSSASSFFKTILTGNNHSHPMIYMRRVKVRHLESVLDFIYNGETKLDQDDINDFMLLAEELEIKGLAINPVTVKNNDVISEKLKETKVKKEKELKTTFIPNTPQLKEEYISTSEYEMHDILDTMNHGEEDENEESFSQRSFGLNEEVEGENLNCQQCQKSFAGVWQLKRHMNTHTNEKKFRCEYCEKNFNRNDNLRVHKKSVHAEEQLKSCSSVTSK